MIPGKHRIIIISAPSLSRSRAAAALFMKFSTSIDQPAQLQGRIDRDLPRFAQGPEHRRQRLNVMTNSEADARKIERG